MGRLSNAETSVLKVAAARNGYQQGWMDGTDLRIADRLAARGLVSSGHEFGEGMVWRITEAGRRALAQEQG